MGTFLAHGGLIRTLPSVETSYALLWALSVHDKATDEQFITALRMLESAESDPQPLVKKAK